MSLTPEAIFYSNDAYVDLSDVNPCSVVAIKSVRPTDDDPNLLGLFVMDAEAEEERLAMTITKEEWDLKSQSISTDENIYLCCYADNTFKFTNSVSDMLDVGIHSLTFFAGATAALARSFQRRISKVRQANLEAEEDPDGDEFLTEEYPLVVYVPRNPEGDLATVGGDATWFEAYGYKFDSERWMECSEEGMTNDDILDGGSPLPTMLEFVKAAVTIQRVSELNDTPTVAMAHNDPYFVLSTAPEFCPTWVPTEAFNFYLRVDDPNSVPPEERDRLAAVASMSANPMEDAVPLDDIDSDQTTH